ncbi:MAG: type II toxin-antitoxin system mRNA interferase toxin, RelE/StbE family [Ignavibacteriales bacterium]|nr:type II toxin-antitoxin system mRNA interferase toxin, RelE/StbE family [Ignavibacteriales bacterium]
MIELVWDQQFKRSYKTWTKKHPELISTLKDRFDVFAENPFHPILKTHSLSGVLEGKWSFRITYEYRILFKFIDKQRQRVLLIDIGSHEEVY